MDTRLGYSVVYLLSFVWNFRDFIMNITLNMYEKKKCTII